LVTFSVSPMIAYAVIALGILYLIAVVASFSVANTVFSTALYVYAETGKVPKGFNNNVLSNAYHKKAK
ncbi:MAG TPA: hypothetical protein VEC16_02105, partial [Alphaproteobacteria bacterium]|nr:hypothetical protein [Alphaproteobacteria bacterium]